MKRLFIFVIVSVIVVGLLQTTGAVRRIRNVLVYQLPFSLFGLPICPDCNVVIISLDVLRADELPCYGYIRNTAPNICAFAKSNSYFTRFYSESSYTLDATVSLFTGLLPSSHHMLTPMKDILNPEIPTLAQLFKKNGYSTLYAGTTNDPNLPLDRGLERGFDTIQEVDTRTPGGWPNQYAPLLPKLRGNTPVFMYFHSYALHTPYAAGEGPRRFVSGIYPNIPVTEYNLQTYPLSFYVFVRDHFINRLRSGGAAESKMRNQLIATQLDAAIRTYNIGALRSILDSLYGYEQFDLYETWFLKMFDKNNTQQVAYLRGLYDERLQMLDTDIKPLLDYLSRPEIKRRTIVIMTAPHGEEFMEHGNLVHDHNIYDTVTHVPFIVASPRIRPGIYNTLAQGIDVFPTVLAMVGITYKASVDGVSFLPALLGNDRPETRKYVVGEHRGDIIQSISDGKWKLYENIDLSNMTPWTELYNLTNDPQELHNVLAAYPEIYERLGNALRTILDASPKYTVTEGEFPSWIDESKRQKLIQSGYF